MKKIYNAFFAGLMALLLSPALVSAQCDPGFLPLHIEVTTDAYPGETSFEIIDSCSGTVLFSSGPLSDPNFTYVLDACAKGSFKFVISDAFGDGICCSYGNGSYSVTFDGALVGSGGTFGLSETVLFGNEICPPPPPPPANDLCADAASISCGDALTGTTIGATTDDAPFCGTSISTGGVWYKYTGTGDAVTLTTCGGITGYDTKLSVYTGNCGDLICVNGNDDDFSISCSTPLASTVTFCSEAGTEYYILVHGFANQTGNFTLSLNCAAPSVDAGSINLVFAGCQGSFLEVSGFTPGASLQWQDGPSGGPYTDIPFETFNTYFAANGYYVVTATFCGLSATTAEYQATTTPPPANDNICNAQALTLGTLTPFDNTCATVETGEATPGAGTGTSTCQSQDGWCSIDAALQNTVWFTFTAPSSGAVSLRSAFDASPFDTQLALWASSSDCSGTLTLVAANDDSPNNPSGDYSSEILPVYCLDSGRTYFVQVDGFEGVQGTGTVIVNQEENKKVIICHKRPRKRDQTIEVSICALPAHLAHGDTEGACGSNKTDETGLAEEASALSSVQVYPNPFNEKTTIEFVTEEASDKVTLEIFNVTGQKLATLFEGSMSGGESKQIDFAPAALSAQTFIYVLRTDSQVNIGKINMIK